MRGGRANRQAAHSYSDSLPPERQKGVLVDSLRSRRSAHHLEQALPHRPERPDPRPSTEARGPVESPACSPARVRWLPLLAALLVVGNAACPGWESPAALSLPQVDADSPPSLEPGKALRISRESAQWASEGWLGLTPRPQARPGGRG
jgi:hypothetical protein